MNFYLKKIPNQNKHSNSKCSNQSIVLLLTFLVGKNNVDPNQINGKQMMLDQ